MLVSTAGVIIANPLHVILDLAFRVSQPLEHGGRSFPRNLALGVQVAHRITSSLVVPKDFGDPLGSRALGVFVASVFTGAIDPKPQGRVHAEFHAGLGLKKALRLMKISVVKVLERAGSNRAGAAATRFF
jgi:hypothetical protein